MIKTGSRRSCSSACQKHLGSQLLTQTFTTYMEQWKVPTGFSRRMSSYSSYIPCFCLVLTWSTNSWMVMAWGPGTCTESQSKAGGRENKMISSKGSGWPFTWGRNWKFQVARSILMYPPRFSGRHSLGRCWVTSDVFNIWIWKVRKNHVRWRRRGKAYRQWWQRTTVVELGLKNGIFAWNTDTLTKEDCFSSTNDFLR
jgi:hypothetical protein